MLGGKFNHPIFVTMEHLFCFSLLGVESNNPKYPDRLKLAILRTCTPLLYKFKPNSIGRSNRWSLREPEKNNTHFGWKFLLAALSHMGSTIQSHKHNRTPPPKTKTSWRKEPGYHTYPSLPIIPPEARCLFLGNVIFGGPGPLLIPKLRVVSVFSFEMYRSDLKGNIPPWTFQCWVPVPHMVHIATKSL